MLEHAALTTVKGDPVAKSSAADIYARLRERIVSGEAPADTLLLETALSEEFAVSRTPAREALLRLESEGVVTRGDRSFRVRRWSPAETLDLYQLRIALEAEAAASAADRGQSLDIARLEHLHQLETDTGDAAEQNRINGQWHRALRSAAGNPVLREAIERVMTQLVIAEHGGAALLHDLDNNRAAHSDVMAAIRDRDAQRARELMRAHVSHVRDLRTRELVLLSASA